MVVAFLTMVVQLVTLTPWVTPIGLLAYQAPNVLVVVAVCLWGVVASGKNNLRHMSTSSFWLFVMWLWSGLSRLMFSPDPAMLLWTPFIILSSALGVVYIYLSGKKKATGV